jgi:hypothetical protein
MITVTGGHTGAADEGGRARLDRGRVADRAQGLPRRVSAPAERLKGVRSPPAAQPREGRVLSGAGRAAPSGGPGSRPARGRLHTTAYGVEELPACRRHILDVLRQPQEDGVIYIQSSAHHQTRRACRPVQGHGACANRHRLAGSLADDAFRLTVRHTSCRDNGPSPP